MNKPVILKTPSLPGTEAGLFFDSLEECLSMLQKYAPYGSEHLVHCRGKDYHVVTYPDRYDIRSVQMELFQKG